MIRLLPFLSLVTPAVALAAPAITDFKSLIRVFVDLLNTAIPIIISLALLAFFWGVFIFVRNSDSGEQKEEGRRIMVWGIIALFVMTAFFGIVRVVQNTFFGGSSGGSYGGSYSRSAFPPVQGLDMDVRSIFPANPDRN